MLFTRVVRSMVATTGLERTARTTKFFASYPRAGLIFFVALTMLASGAPGTGTMFAAAATGTPKPTPEKLSTTQLVNESKPATVWVSGEISSTITAPAAALNIDGLAAVIELERKNGILAASQIAIRDRFFALIAEYPNEFFTVVDEGRKLDATSNWTGSGFIIDESGYVVTNAHVAAPDQEVLEYEMLVQGLTDPIAKDVADMKRQAQEYFIISAENEEMLRSAYFEWISTHWNMGKTVKKYSVLLGAVIAGVTTVPRSIPATIVEAGEPWPGKDVAVIKIDEKNLPTVPLGDDAALQIGDPLYVIGYPGAGVVSEHSLMEPTFTSGTLSARKKTDGGFDVLQTDARISSGDSGGPVFNEYGQVVGMATFVQVDANTGAPTGVGFLMSASSIMDFVKKSGAQPSEGQFTQRYKLGLSQEAASHHKAALETFKSLETLSPGNPYVHQHLALNEAAIAAGKDVPVNTGPVDIMGGISSQATLYLGAAALVLLLGLAGFFMIRGRTADKLAVPQIGSIGVALPGDGATSTLPTTVAAPSATKPSCHQCGGILGADDHFCKNCGAHVE